MRRHLYQSEVALLMVCMALTACSHRPEVVIRSSRGPVAVEVEVADTPESRARGLMYRNDMAPNAGMLFIFPNETEQQFWMKNTPLPLDMVFIGKEHRIVGIVADTQPFTTSPLGVPGRSQYVLEVHAGFCASHGISTGNQVDFVRVPEGAR
ncbi:MAG TPA: DUF192 domain-containing protein [Candidatus Binatia bacterium]|jgi:uncharacterized protein